MLSRSGGLLFCNANRHNEATLLSNERNNSDAVIAFRLIWLCKSVSPNWSTKTENKVNVPFQAQFQFPKQMFTDVVFVIGSVCIGNQTFNEMTGACVFSAVLIKSKVPCMATLSCVDVHVKRFGAILHQNQHQHARLWVMSR